MTSWQIGSRSVKKNQKTQKQKNPPKKCQKNGPNYLVGYLSQFYTSISISAALPCLGLGERYVTVCGLSLFTTFYLLTDGALLSCVIADSPSQFIGEDAYYNTTSGLLNVVTDRRLNLGSNSLATFPLTLHKTLFTSN
jgi:hypothetical protein